MRARKQVSRSRGTAKTAIVPPALAGDAVAAVLDTEESAPDGLATVDPEFRQAMIATAAYYIAEQRGFVPGHELDDWCAAEAAVDATLRRIPAPEGQSASDTA
jgi:hypothetical protein